MHVDRMPGDPNDDRKWQRAILGLLVEEQPHQLTKLELARLILGENPGFQERDAFEVALAELIEAGLLHRCEAMVLLTKPARHYAMLEVD